MGHKNLILYKRKNHLYCSGVIPSSLLKNFILCFGSNRTGDYGSITAVLALKPFSAIIGVASSRQGQSYGFVTIALEKGHADVRTGIRYDKHFLTPQQTKKNFKQFYGYARQHPGLTFAVAYTMHTRSSTRMGSSHYACRYTSTRVADIFWLL